MKRKLLLFSILLFSIISIQARSFILDGINYNISSTVSPFKVAVTSGISYTGDLVIPSTVSYNDTVYTVTSINQNTFYDCSSLTSVYLPNSINSIGTGAFYGCNGLTSINLDTNNPNFIFVDGILYNKSQSQIICCLTNKQGKIDILKTVTTIGTGAFYGCSAITSVLIPNSVSSIGSQAFYNCSGLTTVAIGDSLNSGTKPTINIQSTAFSGCTGLTTLSLNVPAASYYYPFQNLSSLKTLTIGNSVTTIDYSIFSTLTGLTKVILGRADLSPVTISVYTGAFSGSANLDILNLNCNLQITNYSTGAVSPFSKISTLSIGNSVTSIGDYAFIGSTNIVSINIPNAVTSIGISAFAGCNKVSDITLGSSVAKLGTGVFTGCSLLSNIFVDSNNSVYSSINGVLFSKDLLTLIQYPIGRIGNYQIPVQVKTIGSNAFSSCTGLQSVSIPQAITTIQATAFANCTGLTTVTIGHTDSISTAVVSIASNAFIGCQAFTSLVINKTFSFTSGDNSPFKNLTSLSSLITGNGVVSIPDYAFSGCSGLISVRLGQSNSIIDKAITVAGYAFSGCINFATLELNRNITVTGYQSPFITISNLLVGNGVTSIGDQSFRQCVNLPTVTLPITVNKIGNYVFQDCSKLQSVSLSGINSLGQGAFYNCTALTSITIPQNIKIIQSSTFYGCTALSSATLNDSITQIQDNAFYGCVKLANMNIPNRTLSVGASSFSGCSGLTSLTLGTSLSSIASSAFYGCSSLSKIDFPASLRSIGDNAFQNCTGLLSLYIPSTITSIGGGTFTNCTGISSLTIGESNNPGSPLNFSTFPFSGCSGVTSLILNKDINDDPSSSPFMSLSALINITISNRVTHLNTFAFYSCSKIVSVNIPNSVTSIGDAAFNGCTSLTYIKLPNTISYLPNSIFYGCSKLQSVVIPNTVNAIGNNAFFQCTGLNSLALPKGIIVVGGAAFSGCTGLNELIAAPLAPSILGSSVFYHVATTTCKLYVSKGSKIEYQKANQWKDFANIIEKDIKDSILTSDSTNVYQDPITGISKTITISAGGLLSALTSTELATVTKLNVSGSINAADFLIIRDSMPLLNILDLSKTNIQAYTGTKGTGGNSNITYPDNTVPLNAFFNQNTNIGKISLVSVILPKTVTSIGDNAFSQCSGLRGVIPLPPAVTSIGASAYYWCLGLTGTLTIPATVTSIGSKAFSRCRNLSIITLPSTITSIEKSTFAECSSLMYINIPSSVTSIKQSAFYYCGCLMSINIPSSVTSIEDNTFVYCGLVSVTLPNSISSISDYTFTECHALQSITIPAGVKSLGSSVFLNCYSLATISLPSSLTSIGYQVFSNCRNLSTIYAYPTTPLALTDYSTFNSVNKNNCILYVPSGTLKAYQLALQWGDFVNIKEMTFSDVSAKINEPLSVYPNPVVNGFNINGLTEQGVLTLTNMNGSVLFSKPVTDNDYISISALPKGIYLAKIVSKSFTLEQKIVKR